MIDRDQLAADLARMYHSCRNFDDFADRLLSKYAVLELPEPTEFDMQLGPLWESPGGCNSVWLEGETPEEMRRFATDVRWQAAALLAAAAMSDKKAAALEADFPEADQ